jgi:hypothetical protein
VPTGLQVHPSLGPPPLAHSPRLAIPKPQVASHPFLLVNRSQIPIVGAMVDAGGAIPPWTQWSSAALCTSHRL